VCVCVFVCSMCMLHPWQALVHTCKCPSCTLAHAHAQAHDMQKHTHMHTHALSYALTLPLALVHARVRTHAHSHPTDRGSKPPDRGSKMDVLGILREQISRLSARKVCCVWCVCGGECVWWGVGGCRCLCYVCVCARVCLCNDMCDCSIVIHSLTRSLLLAHSLTHSLPHSLTHSPFPAFAHSVTYSLTHSPTQSLTDCVTNKEDERLARREGARCRVHSVASEENGA